MATETPVPAPMEMMAAIEAVRALRTVSGRVSDVPRAQDRDGFPTRPYLPDQGCLRGQDDPNDAHYQEHIYGCLDCRACQTICPAGVQYGKIIEAARGHPPPGRASAALARDLSNVFTSNKALDRIGTATRLYQRSGLQASVRKTGLLNLVPRGLRNAESMLGDIQGGISKVQVPDIVPAQGEHRTVWAYLGLRHEPAHG